MIDVEAGLPITQAHATRGDIVGGTLPASKAVEAVHIGSYDTMQRSYEEIAGWMAEHSLIPSHEMWEFYLSDPAQEPDPNQWKTRIVWPVVSGTT